MKISVLGVIPARYKSTRFEGKPLIEIDGIAMLQRTFMQAEKCNLLNDVIVATDDCRIYDFCTKRSIPVHMTSEGCLTGTDRVAEISREFSYDFYINIQGDEPVIDPTAISQIINEYIKYNDKYIIYNLYKIIDNPLEVNSNTIIKVIVNRQDELMYMSRLPIPFSNGSNVSIYKQQIPVYGFTKAALEIFSGQEKTINERFEDIELLRFIDLGYKVKMSETKASSISVDVPSDIKKVEFFLNKSKVI